MKMVLCVTFLGDKDPAGDSMYQDGRLLIKYCLGGENAGKSDVLASISRFSKYLAYQGKDEVNKTTNSDAAEENTMSNPTVVDSGLN